MDIIKKIVGDPLYQECLLLNERWEKDRLFCKHDFQHMNKVADICGQIVAETGGIEILVQAEGLSGEKSARGIVAAAALLHDIGRWKQYETGANHALVGKDLSKIILDRCGFSPMEIRVISHAIGEHRGDGTSYLGKVLCLADDLSRPCSVCEVSHACYKKDYMKAVREKYTRGFYREFINPA